MGKSALDNSNGIFERLDESAYRLMNAMQTGVEDLKAIRDLLPRGKPATTKGRAFRLIVRVIGSGYIERIQQLRRAYLRMGADSGDIRQTVARLAKELRRRQREGC